MIGEEITQRISHLLQQLYRGRGFKLEYLDAWTRAHGQRVSKQTISRILNGQVRRIRRETAIQLAQFLEAETEGRLKAEEILKEPDIDAASAVPPAPAANGTGQAIYPISTIAGTGLFHYNGDNIAATEADLNRPFNVAIDARGDLLIADQINHRIRKVDASTGMISTLAGFGHAGFAGDGGPAVAALLNEPLCLASDEECNVYFSDAHSHRVRKIDARNGAVTTIVGVGTAGYGGDGGPATQALFYEPRKLQFDADGNLYVMDRNNCRLRRIDAGTGVIATIVGNGNLGFSEDGESAEDAALYSPCSFCLDSNGDLYIADWGNHRVCKVDGNSGVITTVAGDGEAGYGGDGGPATSARLDQPIDVAVDGAGHLFIADRNNHRIRRVDGDSGVITTVAGTGTPGYNEDHIEATQAHLSGPCGLCFDAAGDLYIADYFNSRVRIVQGIGSPR